MMGVADVYYRLQGLSGEFFCLPLKRWWFLLMMMCVVGDALTDKEGNKWDGCNSGGFLFHYVKQDDGKIKLKATRIFTDVSPTFKLMLQKGLIDGETLKGIVIGS